MKHQIIISDTVQKLRQIMDPELGVNIVDLGLIYQIYVKENTLIVEFTTTTPGCPMRRYLQRKIEETLESVKGVDSYETIMVFEPEWTVDMIVEGVEFFSVPPPELSED
ncbi:MAG: metal-sulfur cluster assembly factor [Balneolaceae bacterium]